MLNQIQVKSFKPKDKKYEVADGHGLYLRVYPTGKKIYFLRMSVNSHTYSETLGETCEITLDDARMRACEFASKLHSNPRINKKTFQQVVDEWCVEQKERIQHFDKVQILLNHIVPAIGRMNVEDIDDAVLKRALKTLEDANKISTVHRVIFKVNAIMKFAYSQGYIERIKTLYAIKRFKPKAPTVHRAWIDPDNLEIVLSKMDDVCELTADYFMFCIYSMLRPKENAQLKWEWVDFDRGLITIPAAFMKMNNVHIVPLSTQMTAVLKRYHEFSGGEYVFPSINRGLNEHMSSCIFNAWLRRMGFKNQVTAHGFRATARTWLARNHIPESVAEACLSHQKGSAVVEAYNHEHFLEERREVMQRWADFVDSKR